MHYNDFSFLIASWIVVISTGTVEANQALGLRSPVLLDEGFIQAVLTLGICYNRMRVTYTLTSV